MIRVTGLTRHFGEHTAVRDVSFTVARGECLVLLGTSGSGKTTTLRMINRLLEASGGTVEIEGQDIRTRQPAELRRQIGYVIQEGALFPHYTVAENIAIVPQLLNWEKSHIHARTLELLDTLRLPASCLHQYPHQLSGGQRQRVGLARALAAQPPIVLMDEPLGALDPITRAQIRQEFRSLDELREKTVILVTHDVQEAFELGNRVGLMDQGRMQQLGTPKELLMQPHNNFVRDFFAPQRRALQWQLFSLADLSPYLVSQEHDSSPISFRLTPETSLADAVEQLSAGRMGMLELQGRTFVLNAEKIWTAFGKLSTGWD